MSSILDQLTEADLKTLLEKAPPSEKLRLLQVIEELNTRRLRESSST